VRKMINSDQSTLAPDEVWLEMSLSASMDDLCVEDVLMDGDDKPAHVIRYVRADLSQKERE